MLPLARVIAVGGVPAAVELRFLLALRTPLPRLGVLHRVADLELHRAARVAG